MKIFKKERVDKSKIYLAQCIVHGGKITEIFKNYYDNDRYKNKEFINLLLNKSEEYKTLLENQNIIYKNIANDDVLHYLFKRDILTFFFKGNLSLLKNTKFKAMNGIDHILDLKEKERIIKENLLDGYTLIFKKEEVDGVNVPPNSIVFVRDDFLRASEDIPRDTNLLYVSASLYKNKAVNRYDRCGAFEVFLERLETKETLLNDLITSDKYKDTTYLPEEVIEIQVVNNIYYLKTKDHSREKYRIKAMKTQEIK